MGSRNFENKVKLTKIKPVSIAQLYTKSKVPTDQLLERIPKDCILLKQKIMKNTKIIKNVDDFCLFGTSIEDLEEQIEKLMKLCAKINLKLAPSKFRLSTAVKFGGTVISSKRIREGNVIFIDPPDQRIIA